MISGDIYSTDVGTFATPTPHGESLREIIARSRSIRESPRNFATFSNQSPLPRQSGGMVRNNKYSGIDFVAIDDFNQVRRLTTLPPKLKHPTPNLQSMKTMMRGFDKS